MTSPLRTLFLIPSLGQGGAEAQLVNLVNGLSAKRFTKYLVCFEKQHDNLQDLDQDSVAFYRIPRLKKYDRTLITRLAKFIDEHEIDVVHASLLIAGYCAYKAIKRVSRDCKLVIAIHSTKSRTLKTELIYRIVFQPSLRSARYLIFVSDAQRRYWLSKHRWMESRSLTVHNGIDPEDFVRETYVEAGMRLIQKHNIDANKPIVTCIAAFRIEKNHDLMIKAIHNLNRDVTLCFAGAGSLQAEAEQLVKQLGLQGRVVFMGRLADVRPLLAVSTITMLASKSEAFSMAMLESLAMEVPMLATDVGGLKEAIIPGETGDLVIPNDLNSLVNGLERMLSNPERLRRMGEQGRRLVENKFTKSMMIDSIAQVLEDSQH